MEKSASIRTLIRIFHKNTQMYLPQRLVYKILLALITLVILIPCTLAVGFMSYVMTEALIEAGNPGGGMLFEIQIMSAFSMVFGSWVIFNMLFFSSDREHLVTLPIDSRTLLMAKFFYSYLAESVMECFMLLAVFVGYFLAVRGYSSIPFGPLQLISALLGTVLVPLIPMIYAAVYSMLLMALLKNVRNRDVFFHMTTVLMVIFIAAFLFSLRGMGEINMDNYVEMLGSGRDVFLRSLNIIFFPVPWLCRAISEGSLIHLLLYLLANAALIFLLALCGGKLYREGLYKASALGSAKKAGIKASDYRQRSVFASSLLRELRVLIRTKAFANNCVYVNLILPVSAWGLFHFMKDKGNLAGFILLYQSGKDRAGLLLTIILLTISFLATGLNSVASTSFTREGDHLSLVKYIPVPFLTQILAKAAASFVVTFPVLLLTDGIIMYYMGTPAAMWIYYALVTLLSHIIAVVIGMSLDSAAPYMTWEDEYSALRGNVNSFFSMGAVMLCCVSTILLSYLLYEVMRAPIGLYYAFLFFFLLAAAVFFGVLGFGKTIYENMERMSC